MIDVFMIIFFLLCMLWLLNWNKLVYWMASLINAPRERALRAMVEQTTVYSGEHGPELLSLDSRPTLQEAAQAMGIMANAGNTDMIAKHPYIRAYAPPPQNAPLPQYEAMEMAPPDWRKP